MRDGSGRKIELVFAHHSGLFFTRNVFFWLINCVGLSENDEELKREKMIAVRNGAIVRSWDGSQRIANQPSLLEVGFHC